MNYKKIYNNIIENRKHNPITTGYTEKHHIIPRSIYGTDDKSNLVKLTAREHFICHYLLAKMYDKYSFEWYKMNHAFLIMKSQSLRQERYFNSNLYNSLRENFSEIMKQTQLGEKNSQYGKIWIKNKTTNETKKISKNTSIPDGWDIGRTNILHIDNIKLCKKCGQQECKDVKLCRNGGKIKRLIDNFGFNPQVLGTELFYDEYYSIVEKIRYEYIDEKNSVDDLKNKYNIKNNETMRCILKSLNIDRRTFSDAVKNYNNKYR